MSGEFLCLVPNSPTGQRIDSVVPFSRGLIFAGERGMIWPYVGEDDEMVVYKPYCEPISSQNRVKPKDMQVEATNIGSIAVAPTEDKLFYLDQNN